MQRITLTITRYEKPDDESPVRPLVGSYRGEPMYQPEPVSRENVLVVDLSEEQYAVIKKAALEAF